MKKCIAIMLMLLLLCSLAACAEKPSVTDHDPMNWVWVRDYPTNGVLCDTGYYYVNSGLLCYADFAAGASTVLCNTAGCSHNSDACGALIRSYSTMQLLYWNERIYYFDILEPVLYSRDATGINLKKVATAASKYIEEQKAIKIGRYVIADGYLYYEASISDRVVTAEGVSTTQLVMQSIGRINLTTGKDEIVYEEPIENPADEKLILCAAQGNALLLNYWAGLDSDPEDPDYAEKRKNSKSNLLLWDIETGEMTALFEKNIEECSGVKLVAGGKVYFKTLSAAGSSDAGYMYSYDLNTGKTETACPMNTWWIYGDAYVYCSNVETNEKFVYDMNTGKALPYELENAGAVYNVADNGFVVCITGDADRSYYFVPKEALADGLQESDLKLLYSIKMGYS